MADLSPGGPIATPGRKQGLPLALKRLTCVLSNALRAEFGIPFGRRRECEEVTPCGCALGCQNRGRGRS